MLIGNPIRATITCRDPDGTLFDPSVLKVSFVKVETGTGTTTEDTLTYGGSDTKDGQLTRVSVGSYVVWYTTDVIGAWKVLPRWTHPSGIESSNIEVTPRLPTPVIVSAKPNTFADVPAPTP